MNERERQKMQASSFHNNSLANIYIRTQNARLGKFPTRPRDVEDLGMLPNNKLSSEALSEIHKYEYPGYKTYVSVENPKQNQTVLKNTYTFDLMEAGDDMPDTKSVKIKRRGK